MAESLTPQQIQDLIQAAVQHSHDTFNLQIEQLKATHAAELAELRATQNASIAALLTRKPRPVLPDPPLLTGPAEFDVWLPLLEGKLRVDGEALGTPEAKFMYVYGRLHWKVQKIVRPQLSAVNGIEWDFTKITGALQRIYHDPNKITRASRKLKAMGTKDTDSIRTFLTNREKNSWDAGTTPMNIGSLELDSVEYVNSISDSDSDEGAEIPHSSARTATPETIMSIWTPKGRMAANSTPKERYERLQRNECMRCGDSSHQVEVCKLLPYKEYVKFHRNEED